MSRFKSKPEFNVLFLNRDGETYVFSYTDEQTDLVKRWASRHAFDDRLNFTLSDCVSICDKARELDWKSNAKPNL